MKLFLSTIAFLTLAVAAHAQNSSLSGQVTDVKGAVISGAEVKAIARNKTEFKSRSDAYGVYSIKLPGGTYRIEFKFPRCKSFVIPEYVIGSETNAMLDAELPAGTCESDTARTEADQDIAKIPVVTEFAEAPIKPAPTIKHRKRSKP